MKVYAVDVLLVVGLSGLRAVCGRVRGRGARCGGGAGGRAQRAGRAGRAPRRPRAAAQRAQLRERVLALRGRLRALQGHALGTTY